LSTMIFGIFLVFYAPYFSGMFYFFSTILAYFLSEEASLFPEKVGFRMVRWRGILLPFFIAGLFVSLHFFMSTYLGYAYAVYIVQDPSHIINIMVVSILTQTFVSSIEEFCYRGYVFSALRENSNFLRSSLLSSTMFSLTHVLSVIMSNMAQIQIPVFLLNMFLGGLILSYLKEKTNSLLPPIFFHMGWNLFGYHVFGFIEGMPSIMRTYVLNFKIFFEFETGILTSIIFILCLILMATYSPY
ncbi:MAG: CPBP family intramembrane glutamic endopeptidase, partial [Candidatus Asgardarchaeia archaeon]